MADFEIAERYFETVAVRTGCEHADSDGSIGLKPRVAHHVIHLIIKGVEYLDCIKTADRFDSDEFNRSVECYHTPVRCLVAYDCA